METRKKQIEADIFRIDSAKKKENPADAKQIQARWTSLQKTLPELCRGIRWFQEGNGVFCLPDSILPYWGVKLGWEENSLPALIALNRFLRNKNIQLIVIVYPRIYPVALRARFPELREVPLQEMTDIVGTMLKNDIETIDVSPEIIQRIPDADYLFFYWHQNSHPGWTTQCLAGEAVARRLKRFHFAEDMDRNGFREAMTDTVLGKNYRYPTGLPIGKALPGTPIQTTSLFYKNGFVPDDKNSPVLILGNSFLGWPSARALIANIARYSLTNPSFYHSSNCFTRVFREFLEKPEEHLKGKKVLILPVGVEMLWTWPFWNIDEIDRQLVLQSRISNRIPLPLPDLKSSVPCPHAFQERTKGIIGKRFTFRSRIKIPLEGIPSPGKDVADRMLQVTIATDTSLEIDYGGQTGKIKSQASPIPEMCYFPLKKGTDCLVLKAEGGIVSVILCDLQILELKKEP